MTAVVLRPYMQADEDAAIELWRSAWQRHYPHIDFAQRVDWWRARWRDELAPTVTISVAESHGKMVGFVTVDPKNGYLDQIVVAPEAWGSDIANLLMAEARRISPNGLDLKVNADNARAIRFYEKHGFRKTGEDVNPRSGAPIYLMRWRP